MPDLPIESDRASRTSGRGSNTRRVVGIGELLWDLLPIGERLGGAPFNTVAHLRRFGWAAAFVTAVGADERGRQALQEVQRSGVDASWIRVDDRPTGIARVTLDERGGPDYEIVSPAAWEAVRPWSGGSTPALFDLLVFGTLAQRFEGVREATRQLGDASPRAIRLYDANLRRDRWDLALVADLLEFATAVKMNEAEQRILSAALALPVAPLEAFARTCSERFHLRCVCVTRGALGAAVLVDDVFEEATPPTVDVVDTVGSGDAFAAALGHGLSAGWAVGEILATANALGSIVASRGGAIPEWTTAELGPPGR